MTSPTTLDEARNAKAVLLAALAGDQRINGVGLGYDPPEGYVVKVNLAVAEAADVVPGTVNGVTVRVEVVGTIRSQ